MRTGAREVDPECYVELVLAVADRARKDALEGKQDAAAFLGDVRSRCLADAGGTMIGESDALSATVAVIWQRRVAASRTGGAGRGPHPQGSSLTVRHDSHGGSSAPSYLLLRED